MSAARQEPRVAGVARDPRQRLELQEGRVLRLAGDHVAHHVAQVGRQRHPVTAVAHAVVEAVHLAEVRVEVHGHADLAVPRVLDLRAGELREVAHHLFAQDLAALLGGEGTPGGPATEDQPVVRREQEVEEHLLRVVADAPLREDAQRQVLVERLGGDDVAAHGDDAALEPGGDVAGVAVGRDEDVAGLERCRATS